MPRTPITRLPHESHEDFWAHFLRFSTWRGTNPHNYAGERFARWLVVGLDGWGETWPPLALEVRLRERRQAYHPHLARGAITELRAPSR